METIARCAPVDWRCRVCGGPVIVAMLPVHRVHDDGSVSVDWGKATERLCPAHRFAIEPAEHRPQFINAMAGYLFARKEIGLPPDATLFVARFGPPTNDLAAAFGNGLGFLVRVRDWDEALPEPYQRLVSKDGRREALVMFALAFDARSVPGLSFGFFWHWDDPQQAAELSVTGWQAARPETVGKLTAGALTSFPDYVAAFGARRGRPAGRGRFADREECRQAVVAAIAAIVETTGEGAATQENVGRYLADAGPRNKTAAWHAGEELSDPGRQLRSWLEQFDVRWDDCSREAVGPHE